jgi:hypothetical protein
MVTSLMFSPAEHVTLTEKFNNFFYTRIELAGDEFSLRGHAIIFRNPEHLKLWTSAPTAVLDYDFSYQSSRPDVTRKEYVPRPGFYLSLLAKAFKDCLGSASVLFNANNIGYWPNQFMIVQEQLIYKSKTPLFYDPSVDISGQYTFFSQYKDGTLMVREISIKSLEPLSDTEKYRLAIDDSDSPIPVTGISGYPLIRDSKEVWHTALEQAWDPKLVYYVGDLLGVRQGEIRARLHQARADKKDLVRHGLTILGLTMAGRPIVVVLEESSADSRGVSVREAAQIMKGLDVPNAIVLGGKGDAQLVSTLEGVIARPFVAAHDLDWARPIDNLGYQRYLVPPDARERPIPGFAGLEFTGEYS